MPYGDTSRAQVPRVIAAINAHRVAFTAFDGDIKNGKERCDQPIYDAAVTSFNSFHSPWCTCQATTSGPIATGPTTARTTRTSGWR